MHRGARASAAPGSGGGRRGVSRGATWGIGDHSSARLRAPHGGWGLAGWGSAGAGGQARVGSARAAPACGWGARRGSGRDSFAPRLGWQRSAREVQMDSAGARRPAKPPFARLNCWRLNVARGLILLGGEPRCGMADPAPVMSDFNVTRVRTRPRGGGRALKIDLSQSRCPQRPGMCVPVAWPPSRLHGTGDNRHQLPILAASAGFPSVGSSTLGAQAAPFPPLGVTVAMGMSSSILHRSQRCLPPSPGGRGAVPRPWPRTAGAEPSTADQCASSPLRAAGGDGAWQGTRACQGGQALAGDAGSGSQLSTHARTPGCSPRCLGDCWLLACICCEATRF